MTTELMKNENELVELEGIKITRGQIDLIKRTIFINATDDEMRLFFYECRRRGVHPLDRLIYPVARKDKEGNRHVAFQMGIDYLRAAGEETGRYVGQKSMQYGPLIKQRIINEEGKDEEISVPEWAEAIVLRKDSETGITVEIPHHIMWKEYYPGQKLGHMWRKMPHNQLAKCAEAGALRKAFPRKLGGLYINEEMEQAEAVPFTPIQMPKEKKSEDITAEVNNHPSLIMAIDKVEIKTGKQKDGTPWTLYIFHSGENKFNTFSKTFADIAKQSFADKMNVIVSYSETEKGKKVESISIEDPPEPGSEG